MTLHYLELSNPDTGEHKFYEITEAGLTYTIRYGRIGTPGQSKTTTCDTDTALRKAVDKVLAEKENKGYESATPGEVAAQETRHHALLRLSKQLYDLISCGNKSLAKQCSASFKEFIEDDENKEEFEEELDELFLAGFREGGEGELTFNVDWKDTETMIDSLVDLCSTLDINVTFVWGVAEPEEALQPAQVMVLAHAQLSPAGFGLWHWNTGGDSYEGWISRLSDEEAITATATEMGFDVGWASATRL